MNTRNNLTFSKRITNLLPGSKSREKTIILYLMTLFFSYLDCLVLFTVCDEAFIQSKWLGICVSFGVALVLNVIPLVYARATINNHYGYGHEDPNAVIKICRIAYTVLFSATVVLRFAYADMFGQTMHIMNELDTNAYEDENTITAKSIAVVIFLVLEPLATSLLNYCLALQNNHVAETKRKLLASEIKLIEELAFVQAALRTLPSKEDYADILYQYDREKFTASNEVLDAHKDKLEAEAHILLAEHVGTPEGASTILA